MYSAAVTNRNDTCRRFFFFCLVRRQFYSRKHRHIAWTLLLLLLPYNRSQEQQSLVLHRCVVFDFVFFSCLVWIGICIYKYICKSTAKRNSRTNVSVIHKAPHSKNNGKCGKYSEMYGRSYFDQNANFDYFLKFLHRIKYSKKYILFVLS